MLLTYTSLGKFWFYALMAWGKPVRKLDTYKNVSPDNPCKGAFEYQKIKVSATVLNQ